MNFYEILGVDENATQEEIKKAYKAKSKKFFTPDNQETGDTEEFKKLQVAYSTLKNEEEREAYDRTSKMKKLDMSDELVKSVYFCD